MRHRIEAWAMLLLAAAKGAARHPGRLLCRAWWAGQWRQAKQRALGRQLDRVVQRHLREWRRDRVDVLLMAVQSAPPADTRETYAARSGEWLPSVN